MTSEEKSKISDLKKCDFTEMSEYFKAQSEARKAMTKEEKQVSYRHYESQGLKWWWEFFNLMGAFSL